MKTITALQDQAFVKDGIANDPDWSLPGAEPPESRIIQVRWRLGSAAGDIQAHALMFFITFRDTNDLEVAGTFKAVALWKSDAASSAGSTNSPASWKKIGEVGSGDEPAHNSSEGLRLDVGGDGVVAIRLHTIVAPNTTKVYVTAQQWGPADGASFRSQVTHRAVDPAAIAAAVVADPDLAALIETKVLEVIDAADLPTAPEIASEVAGTTAVSDMVEGACNEATKIDGLQAGTGTATGVGTTGSFGFAFTTGPGSPNVWAVYGWHIKVYTAASDVAIVCGGTTVYLGRSMPIGAVSVVSSTFPLHTLEDAAISFLKTSGAGVEITLYCGPEFVV